MTFAKQLHDLQKKKADKPTGQSDGAIATQAFTKPEDNCIFLVDKSFSVGAKSLDLGKVDIYKLDIYPARPSDDNAIGPERRSTLFDEKTAREVRASSELRFDNFDKLSLTSAEKLDFKPPNSLDTKNLNESQPSEIAKTYNEIDRLLVAKGDKALKPEQRKDLAEQIIRQAADPTTIGQGAHNTCSMATVETLMYTRNPSDAARLITDVALTSQYVATDGRRVRVNPGAHNESRNSTANDAGRSHASEIFQVTGVNLHIDQENRKTNPRGAIAL
jgi:hypothetical protein